MMRSRTLACALACTLVASGARAQGATWTTDRTFSYVFDFGPAADQDARLGLHYDLRYEIARARTDPRGHHFGIAFSALGFQTAARDSNALNTLAAGAALTGRYYAAAGGNRLSPEDQLRWLELLEKPIEDLTEDETEALRRFNAMANAGRRFITYDGHYRYETSQTTNGRQSAAGAAVSGEIPALHRLLDAIVGVSRTDDTFGAFVAQPVRAYIGADWVFDRRRTTASLDGEASYPRLRAQAAWRTLVLNGLILRATYEAQLLLDRPGDLDDIDAFQSFFQAWLVYPLGDDNGAGLMIKYVAGRVGPSFESETGLRLGLNFILQ
jgi:hypothetical protein